MQGLNSHELQLNVNNWIFDEEKQNLHGVMRLHLRAAVATPVAVWTRRHGGWRERGGQGELRVPESLHCEQSFNVAVVVVSLKAKLRTRGHRPLATRAPSSRGMNK